MQAVIIFFHKPDEKTGLNVRTYECKRITSSDEGLIVDFGDHALNFPWEHVMHYMVNRRLA